MAIYIAVLGIPDPFLMCFIIVASITIVSFFSMELPILFCDIQ